MKEHAKKIIKKIVKKHYSQAGQDFWIYSEAFNGKRNGYFLEIGAADGLTFSNTYILEKHLEWSGICIEANPNYINELRNNRKCAIVEACLDDDVHDVEFKLSNLYSGIIDKDSNNKEREQNHGTVLIKTQTLDNILLRYKTPKIIDYLSIDVEGAEYRILKNFPFDRYQFRTMTIERPCRGLLRLLETNQYMVVKVIPGLDTFFVHESFASEYMCNAIDYWTRLARSFR